MQRYPLNICPNFTLFLPSLPGIKYDAIFHHQGYHPVQSTREPETERHIDTELSQALSKLTYRDEININH